MARKKAVKKITPKHKFGEQTDSCRYLSQRTSKISALQNVADIPFRPFSEWMLIISVISMVSVKNTPYAFLKLIEKLFFLIASVLGISKNPGRRKSITEGILYIFAATFSLLFSFLSKSSASLVVALYTVGAILCLIKLRKHFSSGQTNNYDGEQAVRINSPDEVHVNLREDSRAKSLVESREKFYDFSTKARAREYANSILSLVKQRAETVNHTSDPRTYFSALHELIDGLMELSEYEKFGFYKHSTPSEDLEQILKPENLRDNTDKFISRAMIQCAKELGEKHLESEKVAHYKQFSQNLYEAFKNASSCCSESKIGSHYTGKLFTDDNMSRVQSLCDDEESGYRAVLAFAPKKPNIVHVDTEQIIRDEENWRRERLGLSPIEYELRKVDSMTGHAFEEWCANLLRKNGFYSVEVTPGSGDKGVDIIAEKDGLKYAVQCKRYASDLGNAPIQEVVAGKALYRCNVAAVMTNQHFTNGAKELAEVNGVLLWDRDAIIYMLKMENPSLEML